MDALYIRETNNFCVRETTLFHNDIRRLVGGTPIEYISSCGKYGLWANKELRGDPNDSASKIAKQFELGIPFVIGPAVIIGRKENLHGVQLGRSLTKEEIDEFTSVCTIHQYEIA